MINCNNIFFIVFDVNILFKLRCNEQLMLRTFKFNHYYAFIFIGEQCTKNDCEEFHFLIIYQTIIYALKYLIILQIPPCIFLGGFLFGSVKRHIYRGTKHVSNDF